MFNKYEPRTATRGSFVLLHGAWHTGSAWDGVVQALRAEGHAAHAPNLPGARAGAQFSDYVEAVVTAVRQQAERVTLVGHSSAGMLLQAAAPRVADQLERVVFSNAFVLADGQSQLDHMPQDAVTALSALARDTPDHTIPVVAVEDLFRSLLLEGETKAAQDALIAQLVPQPFALLSTAVDTQPFRELELERAVLFCTRDRSADYLGMAAQLRSYRVLTLDGSHELLFTAPAVYARALRTLAVQ